MKRYLVFASVLAVVALFAWTASQAPAVFPSAPEAWLFSRPV